MPKKKTPSYLLHQASGQARVRIDGKDIYLGEYGTQESRDRDNALIADWLVQNGVTVQHKLRVDDLALLYIEPAESFYVKNGKPTSEVHKARSLLKLVVELHGRTRVREVIRLMVIRATAGIETARTVLGHSSTDVTEIYADRDHEAAREVMPKIG